MTGRDLAHRLSVSGAAVSQMERSEVDGGIRLDSLRRVADALDCDLVYGLLPRTTLDDTVRRQATARAARDVAMVDQMMRLEAQDLDPAELEHQVRDYADTLIREGRLWSSGVR
jgi:predicted DNA-binding mobile mystery protein A